MALCLATLTSCVSYNAGTNFQMTGVRQLEVGTTTKVQVLQLFGPPIERIDAAQYKQRRVHFGDEETVLIWRYTYLSESLMQAAVRFLQLEFDTSGRLVDLFYESDFSKDAISARAKKTNFDISLAWHSIIPGKSTRSEVTALLGSDHSVLFFNKPGVSERWYYGYSETSEAETNRYAGKKTQKIYRKSLEIDFDAEGIVLHIKGESDFPDDLARK